MGILARGQRSSAKESRPTQNPALTAGLSSYEKTPVMSAPEWDFHERVVRAYTPRFLIGFNVSLYSLLHPKKGAAPVNPDREARIRQMHVDCILANPQTRLPVLVIELDDSSHNEPEAFERDSLKNVALASASIPLVRLKYKHHFWSWQIDWTLAKAQIDAKLKEAGY